MRSRRRAPTPLGPRVKIIDRIAHPFSEPVEDQTAAQRTIAFEGVSFATHVIGTRLGELYAAVAAIVALTGLPLDVRFPLYLFRNRTDCFPPKAGDPRGDQECPLRSVRQEGWGDRNGRFAFGTRWR